MKNNLPLLLLLACLGIYTPIHSQIGGNQVYQDQSTRYHRNPVETKSIYSTDSTLVITSKVLLNKAADFYVITVGVNSSAKTVAEANQRTQSKIDQVINKIKKLGISKNEVYVDFISETKLYDHTIEDGSINEFFEGFSIRKNLIIKTNRLSDIDAIIDYCAEQEIYDIVKVDYRSKDLEKINDELFEKAIKIIKTKKKRFTKNSSVSLSNRYRIASESFKIYYPKNLYKKYKEAFETSIVNNYYNSNYIKKEVRKEETYYYDGMETELGIDNIIDDIAPTVGVQYVMELVIVYELNKE